MQRVSSTMTKKKPNSKLAWVGWGAPTLPWAQPEESSLPTLLAAWCDKLPVGHRSTPDLHCTFLVLCCVWVCSGCVWESGCVQTLVRQQHAGSFWQAAVCVQPAGVPGAPGCVGKAQDRLSCQQRPLITRNVSRLPFLLPLGVCHWSGWRHWSYCGAELAWARHEWG